MAAISAKKIAHGTLVATTVDTVTLSGPTANVQVYNRGTGDIFVTTDGSTPTVGGAENWVVPSNTNVVLPVSIAVNVKQGTEGTPGSTVVKLISGTTPAYSVIAV